MAKRFLGSDVYTEAVSRMVHLYKAGHRIVMSHSSGKDSTVTMQICIEAARIAGKLPVEVVHLDDEIMVPETYESYVPLIAQDPDIKFHWFYMSQYIPNAYSREHPFIFPFDSRLDPGEWVRQPPACAVLIPELHISAIVSAERFPAPPGKKTICVTGIRAEESLTRRRAISNGVLSKGKTAWGAHTARPLYDWTTGDVWKLINDLKLPYNPAYDMFMKMGLSPSQMRVANPTMSRGQVPILGVARKCWPAWMDRVSERVPGIRLASNYGDKIFSPERHQGETWKDVFFRTCVENAPEWIRFRALHVHERLQGHHAAHSGGEPIPENRSCDRCGQVGCYKKLTAAMYMGDPNGVMSNPFCSYIPLDKEQFRPGYGNADVGKRNFIKTFTSRIIRE